MQRAIAVAASAEQAVFFGVAKGAGFGFLAFAVGGPPSNGEFLEGNQSPTLFQEFLINVPVLDSPGRCLEPIQKLLVILGNSRNLKHIVIFVVTKDVRICFGSSIVRLLGCLCEIVVVVGGAAAALSVFLFLLTRRFLLIVAIAAFDTVFVFLLPFLLFAFTFTTCVTILVLVLFFMLVLVSVLAALFDDPVLVFGGDVTFRRSKSGSFSLCVEYVFDEICGSNPGFVQSERRERSCGGTASGRNENQKRNQQATQVH